MTWSGAVTTRAWIWLMAWVRALIAERRATDSILMASTGPLPLLGNPVAWPLRAARAAAWASVVIGLAESAAELTVRAVHFHHLNTDADEVAGQAGAVAAGADLPRRRSNAAV